MSYYPHMFEQMKAFQQQGGTCYAHAVATSLIEAQKRIVGRIPQKHDELVKKLINKYGCDGANTYKVLQLECPKKQLRCEQISEKEAYQIALKAQRPIIGCFALSDEGWKLFVNQIQSNGSINKKIKKGNQGHAVCISGVFINQNNKPTWSIKNSWGQEWGQKGYFYVQIGSIQMKYYDVFFLQKDLTQKDFDNWKQYQKQYEKRYNKKYNKQDQKKMVEGLKKIYQKHGDKFFQLMKLLAEHQNQNIN